MSRMIQHAARSRPTGSSLPPPSARPRVLDASSSSGWRTAPDAARASNSSNLLSDRGESPPPSLPPSMMPPASTSSSSIDCDPGSRQPIESFPSSQRASVRREYGRMGPFVPAPTDNGKYPAIKRGTGASVRVQASWFEKYTWLEYSLKTNRLYCLACHNFPSPTANTGLGTAEGFQNFKKVGGKDCALMKHQGDSAISHHNIAMNKMKDLLNLDNNIITGSRGLARQHELDIAANRTLLNASVDAVRFLMNQGLACRGNDESTESLNRGNFIELH